MRIVIIFIISLFAVCNVYAEVEQQQAQVGNAAYGLEDLYKLALEKSERIKISVEDTHIAESGKDKALSGMVPRLSGFGSYTRYDDSKFSSTGAVIQPKDSTAWGLRIDRTLSLSGRELTGLELAKENIEKSIHELYSVRETYLLSVASAYYDVLRAKKAVAIAGTNAVRLEKYRDAAQARLKVGELTKTVLLRAQAELSGAQAEIIRADNNLKFALSVLARVAGITGAFDIKETAFSNQFSVISEAASLEVLKQTASAERAEIKAVSMQKKIAEGQVKFVQGAYWPLVTLEGVYLRRNEDPASAFLNKKILYGGVRLDFPFYEGGLRKAEVDEAKARARQAELYLLDLKHSIGIEVEGDYRALTTQKEILKSLEEQLTYAKDNFNAVSKQFDFGLANGLDVIDANALFLAVEKQLTDARFNYLLSAERLKRSTGTLLKTVIKQGVGVSREAAAGFSLR